jgi:transcriptional regulator with XRE-family HTH domain
MQITPTIRAEFQTYLVRKGLSMTEFGHIIDLNVGTVSGIITGNRSISVHQLGRITMGMNLPPDYFYERYIDECIVEEPLNWRRISPFLYRCAELGRLDCLRRVVGMLLDNPVYLPSLFKVAEDSFKKGYNEAAAFLYEAVAVSEKNQHSDRFVVCQYRLFSIRIGDDQEKNYDAAIQFEPYVERLDEIDQLDALKELANTYRSLRRWNKVEEVVQILEDKTKIQCFKERPQKNTRKEEEKKPSRPLFAYLAFSQLLHASVCEAYGDYETALRYTYAYADLSWVKETDGETQDWKKRFQEWAQANIYAYKLLSGEVSVLPDYLSYASSHKSEVLPTLINIIEAANQYDFNVDDVLKQFESEIQSLLEQQKNVGVYTRQFVSERFTHFLKELADYYFRKKAYRDGFKYLINSLEIASTIKASSKALIIKCVELFERFKKYASSETIDTYQNLINQDIRI